jgi:ribosome-associated toxin RatA of RatAB toxin-antitoxin module
MFSSRVVAPSLILLSLAAPALARPTLDATRLSQLGRYDVLTFSDPWGGGIDRGKAIGVIDGTPDEIFRVATDYAKYQDFMPRVRASSVVSRQHNEALVEIAAELPWPAGTVRVTASYRSERLPGEIYRVRFDMLHGNFKQYLGSLYIEPFSDGKTAITYELVAQPDSYAPKSAVNRGVRRSVTRFVHALRQRVNELHRLGYLHPSPPPLAPAPISPLVGAPPTPREVKAKR